MKNHSGRCGEHLVCAELLRRGIIATTFSGNMPDFDILAINKKVQVKTTTGKGKEDETWSISNVRRWFEFDEELLLVSDINGKVIQAPIGKKKLDEEIMFVFVLLGKKYGEDKFFVLNKVEFQDILYKRYKEHCTEDYKGHKVRTRKSFYANMHLYSLRPYEDKWEKMKK